MRFCIEKWVIENSFFFRVESRRNIKLRLNVNVLEKTFLFSGDLGKAVSELVTVMTEDSGKANGQRPPPAFK